MVAERMEAMEERIMGMLSKAMKVKTVVEEEVAEKKRLTKDHATIGECKPLLFYLKFLQTWEI